MNIQFNADSNLVLKEAFREKLKTMITSDLKRFDEFITRIEVHLGDENGQKHGREDKKCLLEARPKNKQPVAVTAYAANYEIAVKEASEKLKKTLGTALEKMQNH